VLAMEEKAKWMIRSVEEFIENERKAQERLNSHLREVEKNYKRVPQ
jgi:hypothetical protein